jgi:uncharacterized protein with PIN domain
MSETKSSAATKSAPETVALTQFFGTAKDVVARYTHCTLCGANLHFSHVTDFSRNLTQETARCPECGVQARQVVHRLQ